MYVCTLCLKENDTDVAHYTFDTNQPILIILGSDFAERVYYETMICYPASPNSLPVFLSTTTKSMTKMTKTFRIIVDETKTKTKIKTRDKNEIEINGILVLTTLTRISEAKFGT